MALVSELQILVGNTGSEQVIVALVLGGDLAMSSQMQFFLVEIMQLMEKKCICSAYPIMRKRKSSGLALPLR
ncbi:hypothetical protein HR52_18965 [Aeromonas hydrophila]|nr:hypothetical protein HR52_18965 [Aeromonas hydrophila]OCA63959.1 hypothetical protein A9R12_15855 [Aeromonas hydrophila]